MDSQRGNSKDSSLPLAGLGCLGSEYEDAAAVDIPRSSSWGFQAPPSPTVPAPMLSLEWLLSPGQSATHTSTQHAHTMQTM
jgi:hypothetical protein